MPFARPAQFRDVPRPHLARRAGEQFRFGLRRMCCLSASFAGLPGGPGDPVHRRHRAQVPPFVQFTGPDLPDRQIRVPTGVDQRQHRGPLRLGQGLTVVRYHPWFSRPVHRPGTVPVVTGPWPADQRARGLGGQLRAAEVGEGRGQGVVGGGGVSVLSEMVSKSP